MDVNFPVTNLKKKTICGLVAYREGEGRPQSHPRVGLSPTGSAALLAAPETDREQLGTGRPPATARRAFCDVVRGRNFT